MPHSASTRKSSSRPGYRDAKLKTAAAVLPDLLGPDAPQLDLRYTGPDGQPHQTAQLILVSNDPYQLDQPGGRGTRARMNSGELGIVAVSIADAGARQAVGRAGVGRAAPEVPGAGGSAAHDAFEVDSGAPVEVGVDGEALTMDPPVLFESRPGALRVLLPRHALQLSPAARAVRVLSRSTIAELSQIAALPEQAKPAVYGRRYCRRARIIATVESRAALTGWRALLTGARSRHGSRQELRMATHSGESARRNISDDK